MTQKHVEFDKEHVLHAKDLIRDDVIRRAGLSKGLVWFGSQTSSEHSVKIAAALGLVSRQPNFRFDEVKHVNVTFDEAPLIKRPDERVSLGVWSSDYSIITDGAAMMPAICVDGAMQTDSDLILRWIGETYPDERLSQDERAHVSQWIQFNLVHGESVSLAAKHWGWCATSRGRRPHYKGYGAGARDLAWEQALIADVHQLLQTIDAHFAAKADKAFYVGDRMTLADCAMLSWPWSLACVAGLAIKRRYPNVWAHAEALRARAPAGTHAFYQAFPRIGRAVRCMALAQHLKATRGVPCIRRFHIGDRRYWGTDVRRPLLQLPPPTFIPAPAPAAAPSAAATSQEERGVAGPRKDENTGGGHGGGPPPLRPRAAPTPLPSPLPRLVDRTSLAAELPPTTSTKRVAFHSPRTRVAIAAELERGFIGAVPASS